MTEYKEGDLVEGVKGESVIRGRLDNIGNLKIDGLDWRVAGLIRSGFTITVIEKAAPVVVLPTEPGAYATNHGSVFVLNERHDWLDFSVWRGSVNNLAATNPAYHPFTRLEPVSETAKKVLDRVNGYGIDDELDFEPFLKKIAADFGVEL